MEMLLINKDGNELIKISIVATASSILVVSD